MKINDIIGEWVAMPHTAKALGLRKANSHWMPINVGNNKANEADINKAAKLLGAAQASLSHGLELADAVLKGNDGMARAISSTIKDSWPPLINKIQNVYKSEDAAGVGIITKQNTTKDVKPGDEYKNVKKLHLGGKK